mmetsp:Transcript_17783/g.50652  ORF Transcript_17783/g.50652 Transcript_17783/m.50652 type:complete len:83 (+) Transcript_17783:567-815(+)
MAGISSTHHVLGVERLLSQFRDSKDTESLRAKGSERSETNQEKVQTRERNHVDCKLSEIAVELSRETEGARCSRNGISNQMV